LENIPDHLWGKRSKDEVDCE